MSSLSLLTPTRHSAETLVPSDSARSSTDLLRPPPARVRDTVVAPRSAAPVRGGFHRVEDIELQVFSSGPHGPRGQGTSRTVAELGRQVGRVVVVVAPRVAAVGVGLATTATTSAASTLAGHRALRAVSGGPVQASAVVAAAALGAVILTVLPLARAGVKAKPSNIVQVTLAASLLGACALAPASATVGVAVLEQAPGGVKPLEAFLTGALGGVAVTGTVFMTFLACALCNRRG
jgi:hypothetical protein